MGAGEAYGYYLRGLRERVGLSLAGVSQLAEAGPYALDKGTLSRFERGHQRMPLAALIPLGRIYSVPSEVLIERLELDTELDRIGGPETSGLGYARLRQLGKEALLRGDRKWDAYAYFRDAQHRAEQGDVTGGDEDDIYDDHTRFVARLNLATVARSLGKNRLALHELLELESLDAVPPMLAPIVQDRIANCYRCLGDLDSAERHVRQAKTQARFNKDLRGLAFACFSHGVIANDRGQLHESIDLFSQAFRANRDSAKGGSSVALHPGFETTALLKLSDAYVKIGSLEKAGRSALAAKKLAARSGARAAQAYSEIALGEVDELNGRGVRALQRWRQAERLGRQVNNRRIRFVAEFYIYRQALAGGSHRTARASQRRLERLAPWIPAHLPLLDEFRDLSRSPAVPQQSDGRSEAGGMEA